MSANKKNKAEPTKTSAGQADFKSEYKIELNLSRRKKRLKTGW